MARQARLIVGSHAKDAIGPVWQPILRPSATVGKSRFKFYPGSCESAGDFTGAYERKRGLSTTDKRTELFVTKGNQGIDAHGAACRNVTSKESDKNEEQRYRSECERISRRYSKEE